MVMRGSVGRRSTRDPLAATLRELDRRIRSAQRLGARAERTASAVEAAPGEMVAGPRGQQGAPGRSPLAWVAVSDEAGEAVWEPTGGFGGYPVVSALPYTPGEVVSAVLEEATEERVTVRLWLPPTTLGEPVVPAVGRAVHLTALVPEDAAQELPYPGVLEIPANRTSEE